MKTIRIFTPDTSVNSKNYDNVKAYLVFSLRDQYREVVKSNNDVRISFDRMVSDIETSTFADFRCEEDAFGVQDLRNWFTEPFSYDLDFFTT